MGPGSASRAGPKFFEENENLIWFINRYDLCERDQVANFEMEQNNARPDGKPDYYAILGVSKSVTGNAFEMFKLPNAL